MTAAVMPDVDAALCGFLRNHAALSPLHSGRVGTVLPAGDGAALRVTALGGVEPWPWETHPEYQVEAWGGTQQAANLLARTVCAAIYDMAGPISGGGHVGAAYPSLRPMWDPDPETGRPRYITQVGFIIYP